MSSRMRLLAAIYVDGAGYYHGEDANRQVPSAPGLHSGFHNYNSQGRDALIFGDIPRGHEGRANILGALQRIVDHMREGHVPGGNITIQWQPEEPHA